MSELIPIATVGDRVAYGTQAEADATQLNAGDAVRYRRHRIPGLVEDGDEWRNGIVDFTWWYESVVVKIRGGPDLHPDAGDEIERLVPEAKK